MVEFSSRENINVNDLTFQPKQKFHPRNICILSYGKIYSYRNKSVCKLFVSIKLKIWSRNREKSSWNMTFFFFKLGQSHVCVLIYTQSGWETYNITLLLRCTDEATGTLITMYLHLFDSTRLLFTTINKNYK